MSPGRGRLAFARTLLASMVTVCGGCAAARPLDPPVAAPLSDARPRPPGIAFDPVLELPRAAASAEPVSGLAVLSEPLDPEPARRVVRAFLEAVVAESMAELEEIVERGAHTRPNAKTRAEPALPWWRRRFDRLDYTALGAEVFYRRSDMEARTVRDVGMPGRALPASPRGDDVVVRVVVSGQLADKLFGPELVFLVRKARGPDPLGDSPAGTRNPDPGGPDQRPPRRGAFAGYKIADLFEDFRLP